MEFCVFYDDQSEQESCSEELSQNVYEASSLQSIDLEPSSENLTENQIHSLLDQGIVQLRQKNYNWPVQLKLHRHHNPDLGKFLVKASFQVSLTNDFSQNYFKYDIVFQNLTLLNLGGNSIANIEPLSQIYLPALKTLLLFQNQCICIKSIAKANFKELMSFNFPQGQIKSLKGIERCELPHFNCIYGYDNNMTLFFELYKLQAQKMQNVIMGDEIECRAYSKYAHALGRKYKNCNF